MASYYGRRASYTPSWAPQRIYPRQEPNFSTSAPLDPRPSEPSASAPAAPPPLYFPGEAQLARIRAQQAGESGATLQSFQSRPASSHTASLDWAQHPTISSSRWKRMLRCNLWWKSLVRRQNEVLWIEWPVEFGGKPRMSGGARDDIESTGGARVSRTISRRSGVSAVDSGVALTPTATLQSAQHPLEPEFHRRVAELNDLIPQHLVRSRVWLSVLEIITFVWIVVLIVALGQGGGRQTRFLEAVELSLIVIIILLGIGVNAVRMKRWALARALRTRSRDWSPLLVMPSSTNQALMSNAGLAFDTEFQARAQAEVENAANTGADNAIRKQTGPTLRWRMRDTEGSWWLSYRPVIKVELVTPATSVRMSSAGPVYPPLDEIDALPPPILLDEVGPSSDAPVQGEEDSRRLAPAYTE